MSSAESKTVFDDLLDLLAAGTNADQVLGFRLPEESQRRLDELLQKNREGTLDDSDRAELSTFEQLEHVVRLLKAKLAGRKSA